MAVYDPFPNDATHAATLTHEVIEDTRIFPESSLLAAQSLGFTPHLTPNGGVAFTTSDQAMANTQDWFLELRAERLGSINELHTSLDQPESFYRKLWRKTFNDSQLQQLLDVLDFGATQHQLQFTKDALPPRIPKEMRNPWYSLLVDLEQLYNRHLKQLVADENNIIQYQDNLLSQQSTEELERDIEILEYQIALKQTQLHRAELASPMIEIERDGKMQKTRVLSDDGVIAKRELHKLEDERTGLQAMLDSSAHNSPSAKDYEVAQKNYGRWLGLVPTLPALPELRHYQNDHAKARKARKEIEDGENYKFLWFTQQLGMDDVIAIALRDYVQCHKPDNKTLAKNLAISRKQAAKILERAEHYNAELQYPETVPSQDFVKKAGYPNLYEFYRDGDMGRLLNSRIQATGRPDVLDYMIEFAAGLAHETGVAAELVIAPRKDILRAETVMARDGEVDDLHRFSIIVDKPEDIEKIHRVIFQDQATMIMKLDDKSHKRPGGYYALHCKMCQLTVSVGNIRSNLKLLRARHIMSRKPLRIRCMVYGASWVTAQKRKRLKAL